MKYFHTKKRRAKLVSIQKSNSILSHSIEGNDGTRIRKITELASRADRDFPLQFTNKRRITLANKILM